MTATAIAVSPPEVDSPQWRRRGRSRLHRKQVRAAYLLITPFFVAFTLLLLLPLGFSGVLSFFQTRIIGGISFVGLDNYVHAATDPRFLGGLGRMALFLVIQVPIMLGLALLFALALDSGRVRASKFVRLAIFVPFAVPSVVATLMWGYLYGQKFGPISQLWQALGLGQLNLLAAGTIIGSMMNIVTWEFVGYNMIILYAALRAIPQELYDAAYVDGAGQFRMAWSIKLPSIRPALILTIMFSIIGTFQLFNEPNLLYGVAPAAIGTDFSPNLYAYNLAFIQRNVNYAAAIAFFLGIVVAITSYFVQRSLARNQGSVME